VPYGRGLLGHSDADALLHAITDAVLGAAGWATSAATSRHRRALPRRRFDLLLEEAVRRVREAGWEIGNVDSTVVAQAPKLAPHIDAMRQRIAKALGVPSRR
jgi:2-C-methyl-D-erythritol 2,4-cyclodiphosphate synthase